MIVIIISQAYVFPISRNGIYYMYDKEVGWDSVLVNLRIYYKSKQYTYRISKKCLQKFNCVPWCFVEYVILDAAIYDSTLYAILWYRQSQILRECHSDNPSAK